MPTTTMHMTTPTEPRPARHAIDVRDLTTRHAGRTVVNHVSFTVEEGEIFVLLGPNGAGTTTLVESIAGLRTPDTGTIRVCGHDPIAHRTAVRHLLGVQPQGRRFRDRLTVREILEGFAGQDPAPSDTAELLVRLGLGSSAATRWANLSAGQRQRVSLAVALAGRPRAVVLDQPTAGLDPQSRREMWTLVEGLRDSGVTVVLATRSGDEAERLADRVALVDRGRVIALDTPHGLTDGAGLEQQLRFQTTAELDEDWIRRLPEVSGVARHRGDFVIAGAARMLFSVVSLLAAHDIVPRRLQVDQPTLHDAFVALAGRRLHGDDTPEVLP